MIKLEDVANKAYFAMRKAQVAAMQTERLGQIHVSDVIKPCMRYVIYNKTTPSNGMSTEDMKSLLYGQLVHSKTFLGKKEHNEMFLGYGPTSPNLLNPSYLLFIDLWADNCFPEILQVVD